MKVILVKTISFQYIDNSIVTIQAGKNILIDLKEMVAFADGYHFEISADEFAYLQ